jgi:hypothetical protein
MNTRRIAIALILVFLAVSVFAGPVAADQDRKLEVSKRPYADVKVILYGASW